MEKVGKKKILILGSSGMIGHQVYLKLRSTKKYALFTASHKNKLTEDTHLFDLTRFNLTSSLMKEVNPDIVINCSGILIDRCEKDKGTAILLNAYLPHYLKEICDSCESKLIQISTDCVFSGKNSPYAEKDLKEGETFYAKVKGLGEINHEKHLTIRTSVIGPDLKPTGKELFSWLLRQKGEVEGYSKSIWSGVSSIELANSLDRFIEQEITGIYNFASYTSISKYDLLKAIIKLAKLEVKLSKVEGPNSDKTLIDTRKILDYKIPTHEEMIADLVKCIKDSNSYDHYMLAK